MTEQFHQFLNKFVRIYVNLPDGRLFFYRGKIIAIDSNFLTLEDQKIGKTLLAISQVQQISEGQK